MTEEDRIEYWLELCARSIPLESRSAWKAMMSNKLKTEQPAIGQQPCSMSDLNLHIVLPPPNQQSLRNGMSLLPESKNRGVENTITTTSVMVPASTAEYCKTDLPFAWLKKMYRPRSR